MNKIAIVLFLVNIAVGQTTPAHPAHAAKPETPHLNVVKEYVRELIEDEDLKTTGEKELSEAKTPKRTVLSWHLLQQILTAGVTLSDPHASKHAFERSIRHFDPKSGRVLWGSDQVCISS